MDETRYAIMSGLSRAKVKPVKKPEVEIQSRGASGWMG
jgi:hypothetical protein